MYREYELKNKSLHFVSERIYRQIKNISRSEAFFSVVQHIPSLSDARHILTSLWLDEAERRVFQSEIKVPAVKTYIVHCHAFFGCAKVKLNFKPEISKRKRKILFYFLVLNLFFSSLFRESV